MKDGGGAKSRHADVQILQKKARVTARLGKEKGGLSKDLATFKHIYHVGNASRPSRMACLQVMYTPHDVSALHHLVAEWAIT